MLIQTLQRINHILFFNITLDTSNGDIEYMNTDTTFHPDSIELNTSSYQDVDTNVTE
jgi:hypothetical protein